MSGSAGQRPVLRPDPEAATRAATRQGRLTKPPGSLGELETLAVHLAALQGRDRPRSRPAAALLFAADHPVTTHGVSPYPSAVTGAMLRNFARGGAAAAVMARHLDVPLSVVDVGVVGGAAIEGRGARVHRAAVAERPAGDLREGSAMDDGVFEACWHEGTRAVDALEEPPRLVVLGEMGIGNSTAAAAVAAAILDSPPDDMVGPGTGASEEVLARKRHVVRDAVATVRGWCPPLEVLRRVGGREMAALAGAAERAAERGIAVLVDGFIVTSAILALVRARPAVRPWLLFGHRSAEPAHARMLAALEARPLLDLGLRLGEGTGALAALALVDLACTLHDGMATFEEAEVPDRGDP